MSDSTADTNIPVTRLPFGAELPPKVPYSTTDSVGVGDAASENLPVQVNNRQIVPVGTSSNPIRAVHLKRKSSGKTVNDVPTSDTPNADDPDTMIATKQYVDSAAIIFKWTSGSSYVVVYGNGWCNFGGYVDNRRITDTPGRYYYNGINWGQGVVKYVRPYIPISAVYGAQVTDNGGAIAPTGVNDYCTNRQSYTIGSFNVNTTTPSVALVSVIGVYFNANQWTLSNIYRGYKLACNAVVNDAFLAWLKSSQANVETLKTYLNSTVRTATAVNYICVPATDSNRAGTSTRANTSDTYNTSRTLSDDKCGFGIDGTSEGGGGEDIPSDPGEDIVIDSSGKILVVTPGGTYSNTNVAGVGSCTRGGSGPYTFTIKPFRSGYLSIDFCCEKVDASVTLSLSVDGTLLAYSHNYPSNRAGITMCIPVKANMSVVIAGSPVAVPRHANVYMI